GGRPMDLARDVLMGHEFCAEIVEHGPRTTRVLKPGTRVCSRPVLLRDTGPQTIGYSNDHPGGYGELMRLTEALLLPVPDGLSTRRRRRRGRAGATSRPCGANRCARLNPRRGCRGRRCGPPSCSSASACLACSIRSWPRRRAARGSWWLVCAWRPTPSIRCSA